MEDNIYRSGDFHTEMSVGEILRRTREHYSRSLEDVEQTLRIRPSQLQAMEEDRFDLLPGKVYAIGFLRAYSEYLGLDGNRMIHLFKVQAGGRAQDPELHFPVAASETRMPDLRILLGSAVALIVLLVLWSFWPPGGQAPDPDVTRIPEPPPRVQAEPGDFVPPISEETETAEVGESDTNEVPLVPPSLPEEQTMPPPPAETERGIVIEAKDPSWVEIRDEDGNAVLSAILKTGDRYTLPEEEGEDFILATGNAGGIAIILDGVELAPLGKPGDVRRNVFLDRAWLEKLRLANDE